MCWQQALNKGQTKVCCPYFSFFFPSLLPLFIHLTKFFEHLSGARLSLTKCTLPEGRALYWNRWLKVEEIIPDTENVKTKAQIHKKKIQGKYGNQEIIHLSWAQALKTDWTRGVEAFGCQIRSPVPTKSIMVISWC